MAKKHPVDYGVKHTSRSSLSPEQVKLRNEVADLVKKSYTAAKKGPVEDNFPPHVKSKLQKDIEAVAEAGTEIPRVDPPYVELQSRCNALEEQQKRLLGVLKMMGRMIAVTPHTSNHEYWTLQTMIDDLSK